MTADLLDSITIARDPRGRGVSPAHRGRAVPGIFGIALDGSHHTAVVRDTDGGQYDGDTTWDRAVGPMQFIPSTWSLVGVDGDSELAGPHADGR